MADLTPHQQVRLLINDRNEAVFDNEEIDALLALEGDNVRRAAAEALDIIADDEVLTSKVIRTQDLTTDGAKVAESLRKRAVSLRARADQEDADDDGGGYFDVVDFPSSDGSWPELTSSPVL